MSIAPITYWNRRTGRTEQEQVYGEGALRWMYETRPGRALGEGIFSRPFVSAAYGALQDTAWSARKIAPFVQQFGIPMEEYEEQRFGSFNDFFIRRFKPGMRRFTQVTGELGAFAEARYFAVERLDPAQRFPVKGIALSAGELLGDRTIASPFEHGPAFIARLCPVDYHRFHFPDSGHIAEQAHQPGPLHSVNPLALQFKPDILITNERRISILDTDHFGRIAYVEVGATMVGKIVHTHPATAPFARGDEKGYFLFGGSTVVVLGEAGAWRPDDDLLEQSRQGRETLVRLGERIASRT